MKASKSFELVELVGPQTIKDRGDQAIQLIDNRIIIVAQALRDFLNVPITINNWSAGGILHESGLRDINTTTGALYSQHKYGRALDLHFQGITPEQVRQAIRNNWPKFKAAGLTTIELNTPTWVHIDCRFTGLDTLYEVPFQ